MEDEAQPSRQGRVQSEEQKDLQPSQGVNGFLEHAHFVAGNHSWCVELIEFLETIVAVDDTTIEVV